MNTTRLLAVALAVAALGATPTVAAPQPGTGAPGTDAAARVVAVGQLLGPQAAADAYALLPAALTAPGPVDDDLTLPAGPGPGTEDTTAGAPPGRALTVEDLASSSAARHRPSNPATPPQPQPPANLEELTAAAAPPTPHQGDNTLTLGNTDPGGSPATTTPTRVSGPLVCPVDGPIVFTDGWGSPRDGGARRHAGIDIAAARGTAVRAVTDGVVVELNTRDNLRPLGGVAVIYATAAGDHWYNAHLDSIAPGLAVGSYVPAGSLIGTVGNTGAEFTGTHLHIERRPGGGRGVDIMADLRAACG